MSKRIISILLMLALILSLAVAPVYATEVGNVGLDGFIENEDGSTSDFDPSELETEIPRSDDEEDAELVGGGEVLSKDEWYAQNGEANKNTSTGTTGTTGTSNGSVSADDMIIDKNGTGKISFKFDLPEEFYENILIELYNRETGDIIQIPVYATNNWEAHETVPAGYYLLYNVLAVGDDYQNPVWKFRVGQKITIAKDNSITMTVELLSGPGDETDPTEGTTPTVPEDNRVSDTEIKPGVVEKEGVGKTALSLLLHLVTGPNLVIILVAVGSCIVVWYIKKKRDED